MGWRQQVRKGINKKKSKEREIKENKRIMKVNKPIYEESRRFYGEGLY